MTFRQIFSKVTVQAVMAVMVASVSSAGFLLGMLTGDQFLTLGVMAFLWAFKGGVPSGS